MTWMLSFSFGQCAEVDLEGGCARQGQMAGARGPFCGKAMVQVKMVDEGSPVTGRRSGDHDAAASGKSVLFCWKSFAP